MNIFNWFKNLKIGLRLSLGFSIVIVFMFVLIAITLKQFKADNYNLDRIVGDVNMQVKLANEMIDNSREVALSVRGLMMYRLSNQPTRKIMQMKSQYNENWKVFNQKMIEIDKIIQTECEVGNKIFSDIRAIGDTAQRLTTHAIDMALTGNAIDASNYVFSTAYPSVQRWITNIQDFIIHSEEHTASFYAHSREGQRKAKITMYIAGVLAIVFTILIVVILTIGITKPLNQSVQAANKIAAGDLTIDVTTFKKQKDEVGMLNLAFTVMIDKLRKQIKEITTGINVLAASTSEIMASVTQMASSAAETATSVSETTTTVEEVKQTAEISNHKAKEISESAIKTSEISREGTKAINNTIEGMNRIKQQMGSIANMVVDLSEQSQAVGDITTTVNNLAEQSNLLAVNAAIESAKAGEQGKGFTVVAQEIKNLAERSKEATKQIGGILKDIQKSVSSAVMATEEGGKAAEEGLKLTVISGETIKTLSDSVDDASNVMIQIAASSQQQLEGMDQMVSAMENIKESSVQAAASTQQSADSVNELKKLGDKLKELMNQYELVK
jgi:methyl-accepting chemotaxis protein